jgi:hypothetical protein
MAADPSRSRTSLVLVRVAQNPGTGIHRSREGFVPLNPWREFRRGPSPRQRLGRRSAGAACGWLRGRRDRPLLTSDTCQASLPSVMCRPVGVSDCMAGLYPLAGR